MGCSNCHNMFGETEMNYEKESKINENKDFFHFPPEVIEPNKDIQNKKKVNVFDGINSINSQSVYSVNNNNNIKNDSQNKFQKKKPVKLPMSQNSKISLSSLGKNYRESNITGNSIINSNNNTPINQMTKEYEIKSNINSNININKNFNNGTNSNNNIYINMNNNQNNNMDNNNSNRPSKNSIIFKKTVYLENNDSNYDDTNKYPYNPFSNQTIQLAPSDDYSKYIFSQINKVREDPQSFIPQITEAKKYIKIDNQNHIFFKKDRTKIFLNKGIQAFDEAISSLSQCNPMKPLIYDSNIVVPPPEEEMDLRDSEYIKVKVKIIEGTGKKINSFWKERSRSPEFTFLFMVIDDNSIQTGLKRKDIMDDKMKYIGISSVEINKNFGCYITLSKGSH